MAQLWNSPDVTLTVHDPSGRGLQTCTQPISQTLPTGKQRHFYSRSVCSPCPSDISVGEKMRYAESLVDGAGNVHIGTDGIIDTFECFGGRFWKLLSDAFLIKTPRRVLLVTLVRQ